MIRVDGDLCPRSRDGLESGLHIVHDEGEVVELLALPIRHVETATLRIPIQLEPHPGARRHQMHILSAMGHRAPCDDLHAERFRVEVDRSFQVANANARVVEAALHGGAIRAEREVLTPVLRRSRPPGSHRAEESELRSPPNGRRGQDLKGRYHLGWCSWTPPS